MKQIDTEMYILFTVLQLTPVTDTDTHKCIAMYSVLLLYNRGHNYYRGGQGKCT